MVVVEKPSKVSSVQTTSPGTGGHFLNVRGDQMNSILSRSGEAATSPLFRSGRSPVAALSGKKQDVKLITFPAQNVPIGGPTNVRPPAYSGFEQPGNVSVAELGLYLLGALKAVAKPTSAAVISQDRALKGALA